MSEFLYNLSITEELSDFQEEFNKCSNILKKSHSKKWDKATRKSRKILTEFELNQQCSD